MTQRTLTIEEVAARPIEDLLREVAENDEVVRVELPKGQVVEIKPAAVLRPLTRLEGSVPPGWKDAIYGPGE